MSKDNLMWILGLTVAFELVTCVLRFGLGRRSARDMAWLGRWTFGVRIHHGYVGLLLVMISGCVSSGYRDWVVRIGGALLLSDLVHHFLVLWLVRGDPEFHLTYPKGGAPRGRGDVSE